MGPGLNPKPNPEPGPLLLNKDSVNEARGGRVIVGREGVVDGFNDADEAVDGRSSFPAIRFQINKPKLQKKQQVTEQVIGLVSSPLYSYVYALSFSVVSFTSLGSALERI